MNRDLTKPLTVYGIKYQGIVMYIGCACNYEKRKNEHLRQADRKSSIPKNISPADVEIFQITDYIDHETALKYEDDLINLYDLVNKGWNKQRSGGVFKKDPVSYNKNICKKFRRENPDYDRVRNEKPERKEYLKQYLKQYHIRKKKEKATNT